uniref:Gamma-tubulin complex component n=1 Tax=Lactuca sativa TaxID=4236 RepID=A0A9R1UG94_LACSA|nr:hypothetical protein LSAT_V11C900462570 [Lactuca sativa]
MHFSIKHSQLTHRHYSIDFRRKDYCPMCSGKLLFTYFGWGMGLLLLLQLQANLHPFPSRVHIIPEYSDFSGWCQSRMKEGAMGVNSILIYRNSCISPTIIVILMHQIFHFVSTLQQYVQSQLSHVSWCRFLHSLKHKVKDLTDLDIVHMDNLNDSQRICFLSDDMKQIAEIIQIILQCALDFRSFVVPNKSAVNIAQVGGLILVLMLGNMHMNLCQIQ